MSTLKSQIKGLDIEGFYRQEVSQPHVQEELKQQLRKHSFLLLLGSTSND